MIITMCGYLDQGYTHSDVTGLINSQFNATLHGTQRPGGKGFRGATTRKLARLRANSCDWENNKDKLRKIAETAFGTWIESEDNGGTR